MKKPMSFEVAWIRKSTLPKKSEFYMQKPMVFSYFLRMKILGLGRKRKLTLSKTTAWKARKPMDFCKLHNFEKRRYQRKHGWMYKNQWVSKDFENVKVDVNREIEVRNAKTKGFLMILQFRKSTLPRKTEFYIQKPKSFSRFQESKSRRWRGKQRLRCKN